MLGRGSRAVERFDLEPFSLIGVIVMVRVATTMTNLSGRDQAQTPRDRLPGRRMVNGLGRVPRPPPARATARRLPPRPEDQTP